MKLPKPVSQILNNKYFLYVVALVSLGQLIHFLYKGNVQAVLVFIVAGLIMTRFSKNMSLVLVVPLILVNVFIAGRLIREGLDNMSGDDTKKDEKKDDKKNSSSSTPPPNKDIATAKTDLEKKDDTSKPTTSNLSNITAASSSSASTPQPSVPEPFEVGQKQRTNGGAGGPRIDYGSTIEAAYDDLNNILGGEGIQRLTGDTHKLMEQQMKLAEAMNNMGPLLQNAKDMLKSLNLDGVGNLGKLFKKE